MYGLVLEGGGAKGAYQIGAYRALSEMGIKIKGVSGTSIGALNGAMIVQGDLNKAYDLWYNITPSKVFNIEDEQLKELINLEIKKESLSYWANKIKALLTNKGVDTGRIKKIIKDNIDEEKIRNSNMDFGIVTVSISDKKPLELFKEDIPKGKMVNYLMASASFPLFKREKIDEKVFLDGGFYDNVPISMLLSKGYKDIIVIRSFGLGRTRKVETSNLNIKYIEPKEDLGRILDFSKVNARKNLKLGYFDTLKTFKKLKGKYYYLKPLNDELFFIKFLLDLPDENIYKVGKLLGLKETSKERLLLEFLIPKLGYLLDVDTSCGYEDILILLFENIAKKCNVERFKIYDFDSFVREIKRNFDSKILMPSRDIPSFIKQYDILSRVVREEVLMEVTNELFKGVLW
ncbi:MAG: patatin-like phospholipase family protein [Firmicutes bacterium]|nr:patatin-like phospholipase family protein [Bacillota bacterium]